MSYARVGTYEGNPDELQSGFDKQTDAIQQLDGFERAYLLIDRDSGKALSVTVWGSQEALEASAAAASRMRDEATQPSGATIVDVSNYEVAISVGD